MLELHRAERADRLVDALAEVMATPAGDPFVPEVVAVPERGVERWLAQRLSHRLGAGGAVGDAVGGGAGGVCANVRFPAPAALLGEVVDAVTGTDPDEDPWSPGRAVWPLLELIDAAVASGDDRFAGLAAHLERGGHGRRYALARALAGLFGSYATHRPSLLRAWHAGRDRGPADLTWQPELWRRLRSGLGVPGPAERLDTAVTALRDGTDPGELPARLSLFGPTRLAAEHLAVLEALSTQRDVHLWLPHPSPVMWDAVRADAGAGRDEPPARADDRSARLVRNPLLRSLGRDVRELALRLPPAGSAVRDTHHEPVGHEPEGPTLLRRLQRSMRDDTPPVVPGQRPLLDAGDRSVVLHSCHGPDRQVEVLREALLGLLAADPGLEPRDIVVMCPDIEVFAPLITASFGLAPDPSAGTGDGLAGPSRDELHPGHLLRVRLADRALRQANPLLGAVSTLLELAGSRLSATQVLDLIASGPVRRRFRLDDDALERVSELVTAAGVRWGLDAAHRRPYKLDGVEQNTWRAGLDRMLLGVTMAETPGAPAWLGTALPLDEVDSSDADLVGRLAEIVDRLGTTLDALRGPQPLTGWIAALLEGLAALTDTAPSDDWQAAQARAELADVLGSAGPQAATVDLDLTDVRGLLAERLRGRPSRANFRTGTLTVATLVPMRAVPHKVVCLLGCDDGVFPRAGAPDGDDVLARDPVVGERDPRGEDRQLLLDAIGSATEHLVVVCSGADERSGAERPPSVPIGELFDAVDACVRTGTFTDAGIEQPASESLRARHPLQPFDRRNFTPGGLLATGPFSFDRAALRGAEAAAGERVPVPLFPAEPLAGADAEPTVELDDLVAFAEHPVRAFLRQRVRVLPPQENAEPDDALPVELNGLDTWKIGDRLLADRIAGAPPQTAAQAETLRGDLPPGGIGHRVLSDVGQNVEPLVAAATAVRTGEAASQDLVATLTGTPMDGIAVAGTVPGIHGDAVVRVEYSRLKAKHRLRAWVQLLALAVAHPDRRWTAITVGRGTGGVARSTLGPVEPGRARGLLADLVALRDEGLREPLPLPTDAASVYARARSRGVVAVNALATADARVVEVRMRRGAARVRPRTEGAADPARRTGHREPSRPASAHSPPGSGRRCWSTRGRTRRDRAAQRPTFAVDGPLPSGTTVLEASAGTGKTYTIAALATRYVAEGVAGLDRLMLVTFGRDATQELRERVRERLVGTERALAALLDSGTVPDPDDRVVSLLADGDRTVVEQRRERLAAASAAFRRGHDRDDPPVCQQMLAGLGVAADNDPEAEFVEHVDDIVTEVVDDFYVRKYASATAGRPVFTRTEALTLARRAVADPQAELEPRDADPTSPAAVRHGFAIAVRGEVDARKRRLRVYSYDDMLSRLAAALRDPERGPAARDRLRSRFSVVLVDEFQDTDPLQWEILRRAFHDDPARTPAAGDDPARALVLIGDPKQAIYAFRGADVHSYLDAAKAASDRKTLETNRRSDAALLGALEGVFDGAALGDPEIVVHPVQAHHEGRRLTGTVQDAPMRLRLVDRDRLDLTGRKLGRAPGAREIVARDVAADLSRLLDGSAAYDGATLRPGQVAVLVRTNAQGVLVRDACAGAGVPAVLTGSTSVFTTPTARDWLTLLEAVEQPQRSLRLRAAALTRFVGHTVEQLCGPESDRLVDALGANLRIWHAVLAERGVAAMQEVVFARYGPTQRLLSRPDGERDLTDLRHVGQALHSAALERHLGPTALTEWLRHRIGEAHRDTSAERSRRLESDADAVQIVTVHRSKGLEFPVVYLPFAWDRWVPDTPDVLLYHDTVPGLGATRILR